MTLNIDTSTGEILDTIDAATTRMMRDLDLEIQRLDGELEELKREARLLKEAKDAAISKLRSLARGERALPLEG